MTSRTKLTNEQITAALTSLPGWSLDNSTLHREIKFDDFIHAFRFMTAAALIAEKMNHHPNWSNVYNTVTINLSTHDADGITQLDINLASEMNKLI